MKCWAGWITIWNQDQQAQYADDSTQMVKSEEELKNLLVRVKKKSEKPGLRININ